MPAEHSDWPIWDTRFYRSLARHTLASSGLYVRKSAEVALFTPYWRTGPSAPVAPALIAPDCLKWTRT